MVYVDGIVEMVKGKRRIVTIVHCWGKYAQELVDFTKRIADIFEQHSKLKKQKGHRKQ